MGLFTYYKENDGAWYAKCTEQAHESGYTYSDGTPVATVYANSTKYFMVEPIKWRVLTDDYNGKKLLLAENILINGAYYNESEIRSIDGKTVYPNNYKESRIRAYLNGLSYKKKTSSSGEIQTDSSFSGKGFLQTAFTLSEQNLIVTTSIDNSARSTNPDYSATQWNDGKNTFACENTSDKIFLLSVQEVTKTAYGLGYNSTASTSTTRVRTATDFSKANGVYYQTPGCQWALRSPYWNTSSSNGYEGRLREYFVKKDGLVGVDYIWAIHSYGGICPALCVE